MTLDETWELCLQMWKWIAEEWKPGKSVHRLKAEWLERHGHTISLTADDCFFCQYAQAHKGCYKSCPGELIENGWGCTTVEHNYETRPKEFYVELVRLNTIRLEKKNMAELKCEDGTVVQISAETEADLRKAFGPKPEPTYKVGDVFWRDVVTSRDNHYLQLRAKGGQVGLYNTKSGYDMNGYFTVQDINAITFAEVQSMTTWPEGLRYVERFTITE